MAKVYVRKVLQKNLKEKDTDPTMTFTNEGNFYLTNKNGSQMQITNLMTGYEDLKSLETENPAMENKLYLTKESKLYIFKDDEYVTFSEAGTVKTLVFILEGNLNEGIQNILLQLPHSGVLMNCKAFCVTSGESVTEVSIEKTKESYFPLDIGWENIFSQNISIPGGSNVQDDSYIIKDSILVNKNDYFRINAIKADSEIKHITIELNVKTI